MVTKSNVSMNENVLENPSRGWSKRGQGYGWVEICQAPHQNVDIYIMNLLKYLQISSTSSPRE